MEAETDAPEVTHCERYQEEGGFAWMNSSSPCPIFGGKSKVADLVWRHFGAVTNYVEPFAGSGAVLLARPTPFKGVETLNDWDCYLANAWRAFQAAPDEVAAYADWPVSEVDLHARHRYLVLGPESEEFRQKMRTDPLYYDARFAGWYIWGACCWIGGGWCRVGAEWSQQPAGQRPLTGVYGNGDRGPRAPRENGSQNGPTAPPGVLGTPHLSEQVPYVGRGNGCGMDAATIREGRPQLADAYDIGRGVNASPPARLSQQIPALNNGGNDRSGWGHGVLGEGPGRGGTCAERRAWLLDWFARLADRLRNVRVCCGDWSRVCSSPSVLTRLGATAVFLDPPYPARQEGRKKSRAGNLYASDAAGTDALDALRDDVLAWCQRWGPDHDMRIAVCGYEGDGYEVLAREAGWREQAWKAGGGYGNRSEDGKANATRERIWFSPHCCFERTLFDHLEQPGTETATS